MITFMDTIILVMGTIIMDIVPIKGGSTKVTLIHNMDKGIMVVLTIIREKGIIMAIVIIFQQDISESVYHQMQPF